MPRLLTRQAAAFTTSITGSSRVPNAIVPAIVSRGRRGRAAPNTILRMARL